MDHDILVDAARELFDASKTTWAKDSSLLLPNEPPLDKSAAQYTGGDKRVGYFLRSYLCLFLYAFVNLHFLQHILAVPYVLACIFLAAIVSVRYLMKLICID